ncbi:MAG: hypothetical protein LC723_05885 [Actinobacteria bacterium]|nr:hypothetical protein [Actinomycetota bacterium]
MTAAPRRLRDHPWFWASIGWVTLRTISSVAAWYASAFMHSGPTVGVAGYSPPKLHGVQQALAGVWLRSDALWYLKIIVHGYGQDPSTFAFFPAFPLLAAIVRPLIGGSELWAGLLVASALTFAGLYFLFRLTEQLFSASAARYAVVAVSLFPTAFFLVAPYGESAFFFASTCALWLMINRRYALATVLGAMAGMSRPIGFLLTVALVGVVYASRQRHRVQPATDAGHGPPADGLPGRTHLPDLNGLVRPMLAALAPLWGLVLWLAYSWGAIGRPLAFLEAQKGWQRTLTPFPLTILKGIQGWLAYRRTSYGPYFLADFLALVVGTALIVGVVVYLGRRGHRWIGFGLGLFGALWLILPMTSVFLPRPLLSMPRFVLGLAPLLMVVGGLPKIAKWGLLAVSGLLLGIAAAVYVSARPLY